MLTYLLVRGVLWLINFLALGGFARALSRSFGLTTGIWYLLFQNSQFHIMYYASRTLPNMFALPISMHTPCTVLILHSVFFFVYLFTNDQ